MAPSSDYKALGLEYVEAFTRAHRAGDSMYQRETLCSRVQFPACLVPPRATDRLAGKRTYPEVGYSVQYGGMGFYADFTRWPGAHDPMGSPPADLARWQSLRDYWSEHDTSRRCIAGFAPEYADILSGCFTGKGRHDHAVYPLFRMAGLQLDMGKLVSLGLTGLEAEVNAMLDRAADDDERGFLLACHEAIALFRRCVSWYADEAGKLPPTPQRDVMIEVLSAISRRPPRSFHEGLQLCLLAATLTGTINFGRLDTALGGLLSDDLDHQRLTWADAKELMANFYVIIEEEILQWDGRIIVGGKGRSNEAAADRFATLAMEVTDSLCLPMPQLSLRFYAGQDPALLDKAYEVLAHGKTYPMLYNDDVNIPAVMKSFGVDEALAEQYIPYGCGEYMLYHRSCDTPNGIINLTKALEAALNHGRSLTTGSTMAPDFGCLTEYTSFDQLWSAYDRTVTHLCGAMTHAQERTYDAVRSVAPFSLVSLLYDDCMQRRRPLFAGGIQCLGGTCETYGNTNCADSLTAIKQLVYEPGGCEGQALLDALRDNWAGHASLRRACRRVPKYGNDDDVADDMLLRVHDHICARVRQAGERTALDHYRVVVINNHFNTVWGEGTTASADGRANGEALAPGNAPSGGSDHSGLTAVLNSQAKPDPSIHAGAVQNVKLTSSFPVQHPELYRNIFEVYFQQGGAQIMITVTNREDLLEARKHPEKYANLIVRVGGFSARFVDLDPHTQEEIISHRTRGVTACKA